jgi:hypothetical protein
MDAQNLEITQHNTRKNMRGVLTKNICIVISRRNYDTAVVLKEVYVMTDDRLSAAASRYEELTLCWDSDIGAYMSHCIRRTPH